MSAAKSAALKNIIRDANSKRLGPKRLPRDRAKLLGLIKEELEEDEDDDKDESGEKE
jgi:hypothetical protein